MRLKNVIIANAQRIVAVLFIGFILTSRAELVGNSFEIRNDIELVNELEDCLALKKTRIQLDGQITKLHLTGSLLKKIGSCGCASRLISYRVLENISDNEDQVTYERAYGILLVPSTIGGEKNFEVAIKSDENINYVGKVSVQFSCKLPD